MAEWYWKGRERGGIKGITKTIPALCRWALSFNLRSHVAMETTLAFGLGSGDNFTHNEGRQKVDLRDEDSLLCVIK